MTATQQKTVKTTSRELEDTLSKAMKKISCRKENDICRYLPVVTGGYMHHFTLRKMKHESPDELCKMVTKFIINCENPKTVAPKPRAARGSRKRRDQISFTKGDLEHMLRIARLAGDKDLVRKLTPKRDLRTIKRELIASIRHTKIEPELWNSYCEIVAAQNSTEDESGLSAAFSRLAATTAHTVTAGAKN